MHEVILRNEAKMPARKRRDQSSVCGTKSTANPRCGLISSRTPIPPARFGDNAALLALDGNFGPLLFILIVLTAEVCAAARRGRRRSRRSMQARGFAYAQ
jgi:hypothetical protein